MTTVNVNGILFVPLTRDSVCACCGAVSIRQLDDRGAAVPVAVRFRWCVHELCPRCAAGVVDACPVCGASRPHQGGVDMAALEAQALAAAPVEPSRRPSHLWPIFAVAGLLAAALAFCPQLGRLLGLDICR